MGHLLGKGSGPHESGQAKDAALHKTLAIVTLLLPGTQAQPLHAGRHQHQGRIGQHLAVVAQPPQPCQQHRTAQHAVYYRLQPPRWCRARRAHTPAPRQRQQQCQKQRWCNKIQQMVQTVNKVHTRPRDEGVVRDVSQGVCGQAAPGTALDVGEFYNPPLWLFGL